MGNQPSSDGDGGQGHRHPGQERHHHGGHPQHGGGPMAGYSDPRKAQQQGQSQQRPYGPGGSSARSAGGGGGQGQGHPQHNNMVNQQVVQPHGHGHGGHQQQHQNQQQQHHQQQNHNQMNMHNNMQKTTSDASMTNTDENKGSGASTAAAAANINANTAAELAQLSAADDDVVPTVFRWEHGGRDVYITGTFNGWTRQIPMHRSGNDFTYIHNLKRGKHAFKFIVDDEWRFAPDQPTVADIDGRINNFIDVTDFKPYTGDKSFETEKNAAYYSVRHGNASNGNSGAPGHGPPSDDDPMSADGHHHPHHTHPNAMDDPDGEVFTHTMPDLDEYTKDPPPLPPHLRHIILNKPPQLQDTAALPVPQHVALNHLYCTAIRDNMMVLGITQRFKTKFVTTVYYSPELKN
eukprot:847478_1